MCTGVLQEGIVTRTAKPTAVLQTCALIVTTKNTTSNLDYVKSAVLPIVTLAPILKVQQSVLLAKLVLRKRLIQQHALRALITVPHVPRMAPRRRVPRVIQNSR